MKTMQNSSAVVRDLNGLESHLLSKIEGQNHVIARVCSVLERGQLGLQPIDKPLGSFLFLGPTGVGKTELTLEFTRYLFGGNEVYRFDMSEFLHLDNVKLFMGDETGNPGRLGNVLSQHQQGVLLFDEIEKAHRLIWDLFLQMLDAARITLADHRHLRSYRLLPRMHEQHWLPAAFASNPASIHNLGTGRDFRTVQILSTGTRRAL
jgi:ATP-dependent Clp protease ATP-binding subunit ClpA